MGSYFPFFRLTSPAKNRMRIPEKEGGAGLRFARSRWGFVAARGFRQRYYPEAGAAEANVVVRVARTIVQVQRLNSGVRAIVPIAATDERQLICTPRPSDENSYEKWLVIMFPSAGLKFLEPSSAEVSQFYELLPCRLVLLGVHPALAVQFMSGAEKNFQNFHRDQAPLDLACFSRAGHVGDDDIPQKRHRLILDLDAQAILMHFRKMPDRRFLPKEKIERFLVHDKILDGHGVAGRTEDRLRFFDFRF
jgi:hypothetical protein